MPSSARKTRVIDRDNVLSVSPSSTPLIAKNRKRRQQTSIKSKGLVFTGRFECSDTIHGEGTITYPLGDRYYQIQNTNRYHIAPETVLLLPQIRRQVPEWAT
jgi:hypothetical protein